MLHEWLSKLATKQTNFQGGEPREWNPRLIEQLEEVSNPVSRDVDFWVDIILEGYINEFVVDTITSNSEVERNKFQGPHNRYMLSLKTWIKCLYVRKEFLEVRM